MTASNRWGTISNAYDGANRLISSRVSGFIPQSATITYQLDPVGNSTNTQVAALGYEVTRTFDIGERLASLTAGSVGAAFAYNPLNGLLESVSYTNGMVCTYWYDSLDRLSSVTWSTSNGVLRSRTYSYNAASQIASAVCESGERVDYSYDSLDRLTGEKHADAYGQTLSDDRYEYDLAGNRTKKTVVDSTGNPLVTVNCSLGAGNRLASWSVAETNLMGQIDVAGVANEPIGTNDRFGRLYVSNANTSVKPLVSGTNFCVYDLVVGLGTQKVVAAIRDAAGNMGYATNTIVLSVVTNGTYQYNAAGCLTNIQYGGNGYQQSLDLTWNGKYRLTAASTNGGVAERYGYDALGRRVWTWDATAGTNWMIYDGQQVVADLNETGGVTRTYAWGPGIDNLLAITIYSGTPNTYYALKDHLGSVLALTDGNGLIVESYRYDAWGRTTLFDATGNTLTQSAYGNRYCWQGREYSFKTGLYYFRARYYDPVTGRFISKDPSGIANGHNEYVALNNNPVNFIDPTGEAAIEAHAYWSDVAVSGQDAGGVLGNLQTAGASVMMSFIDFWGTRALENNASLSGQYSTSDECQGNAWKHGLFAGGQIALSAASAFGGNNAVHPFYRFVGPGSRPGIGAGTWLARGTRGSIPYGNIENAISRLQIPPESQVNAVMRVRNVWWRYIAGPRPASGNPAWGAGGGLEYRIGGF